MNYFNLNDVPDAIVEKGELVWESEAGFTNFLTEQGIRDTRYVSEAKWDMVKEAIDKLEVEEDEY